MTDQVLIIGASGCIAQAAISRLLELYDDVSVFGVSRSDNQVTTANYQHTQLKEYSEPVIADYCQRIADNSLNLVICTLGLLHDGYTGIQPEKRIEDLSAEQLTQYFAINAITPAIWLKHLLPKVNSKSGADIVLFSARVGSISDNGLGGWYGYRASKSALNMLVKTAQVEYQRRAPGCELMLYHPGTVDTALSRPFQRNVKKEKLFTPEFTVSQLLHILKNKPNSQPPYYLDWNNRAIEW